MPLSLNITFRKILQFTLQGIGILFFILSFVITCYWLFDKEFPFIGKQQEPATALITMVITVLALIINYLNLEKKSNTPSIPTVNSYYEGLRLELIKRGKRFWIEEKLNKSLYHGKYIEVEKSESPYSVIHPWNSLLKTKEIKRLNIKSSTKISEIFDLSDGKLLILGEPGAGKTIALLELAKYKLLESEKVSTSPIPLIFNLSNWTNEKQTIFDWIIDELTTQPYMIPRGVAEFLIQNNQCLLLLDSLDAVEEPKREACIKALNHFFREHNLTQIAVCCRRNEYSQLKIRLELHGAIILSSLTSNQISNYLSSVSSELKGLAEVLKKNKALSELSKIPLWLGLMTTIYEKMPAESINLLINQKIKEKSGYKELIKSYTKNIIELYIQQTFENIQQSSIPFTKQQTIKWLSWIAKRMHPDSSFSIDQLQPYFLSHRWTRIYELIFGYIMMFITIHFILNNSPLIIRITEDPDIFKNYPVYLQASIFFSITMVFAARAKKGIKIIETWQWSWNKFFHNIKFSLIGLMAIPVFIWIMIEFRPIIKRILFESFVYGALFAALFVGYAFFRFIALTDWWRLGLWYPILKRKQPIQAPFHHYLKRILKTSFIIGGILVGLIPLLVGDYFRSSHPNIILNFIQAIKTSGAAILFFIPIIFFFSGLKFYQYEKRVLPNQGILLSLKNAMKAYYLSLILGLIIFWCINGITVGNWNIDWSKDINSSSFIQILYFSHTVATFSGFTFGGLAVMQHFLLRIILVLTRHTPWSYAKFLNFVASLVILRKAGGEYEFIHEYIRIYFADIKS